jgi:hypothetical protein
MSLKKNTTRELTLTLPTIHFDKDNTIFNETTYKYIKYDVLESPDIHGIVNNFKWIKSCITFYKNLTQEQLYAITHFKFFYDSIVFHESMIVVIHQPDFVKAVFYILSKLFPTQKPSSFDNRYEHLVGMKLEVSTIYRVSREYLALIKTLLKRAPTLEHPLKTYSLFSSLDSIVCGDIQPSSDYRYEYTITGPAFYLTTTEQDGKHSMHILAESYWKEMSTFNAVYIVNKKIKENPLKQFQSEKHEVSHSDLFLSNLKSGVFNVKYKTIRKLPIKIKTLPDLELKQSNSAIKWLNKTLVFEDQYDIKNSIQSLEEDGLISNVNDVINNYTWLEKQHDYISSLSFRDKYVLQNYTHHGDVIVNSYLRKTFHVFEDFDFSPFYFQIIDFFQDLHIGMIRIYIKHEGSFGHLMNFIGNYKTFNEGEIFEFCKQHLNVNFINAIVKKYIDDLDSIISKSPPLESKITVFRGVTDDNWIKTDDKGVLITDSFWSTSISLNVANHFSNKKDCCIHKIVLLPGTRCIALMCASKYSHEKEILLGKHHRLLLTKDTEYYNLPIDAKITSKVFLSIDE